MVFPTEDPLTIPFDDYLNENHSLSDNDNDNKETFNSFLDFFEKEATARGNGYLSPIGRSTSQDVPPPQPWRKGLWCLNQNDASSTGSLVDSKGIEIQNIDREAWDGRVMARNNARGKAFINFSRPGPTAVPRTPPHMETKRSPTTSPSTARKGRHARQTFSREGTLSPKSSYARNQHNNKMVYQEALQDHLQNFHLMANENIGTLSPPPSGRPSQRGHSVQVNGVNVNRDGMIVHSQALAAPMSDVNDPNLSVELGFVAVDPGLESVFYSNSSNNMLAVHEPTVNQTNYLQDPHDKMGAFETTETLNSPIGSQHLLESQAGYRYLGQMQQTWSPPATSADELDAPGSYQEHYPIIAAPTPHRPTHHLLQNPVSPQIDGLGIRYSRIDSSIAVQTYPTVSPLETPYSYPPLPEIAPESIHTFVDTSPFTTLRHHYPADHPASRSTSPSISPKNTKYNYAAASSRSLRQTSPSRQSASRRKSIGARKASSFTAVQQKAPRTPKTATGPGAGSTMDFVNFTPKDSVKLLGDVAPSGSSKTRARREQEARDKRRRLSEVAVRAVRRAAQAAGADVEDGEVEALEKTILA